MNTRPLWAVELRPWASAPGPPEVWDNSDILLASDNKHLNSQYFVSLSEMEWKLYSKSLISKSLRFPWSWDIRTL